MFDPASPLAAGFPLTQGSQLVTVPDVVPGDDYAIIREYSEKPLEPAGILSKVLQSSETLVMPALSSLLRLRLAASRSVMIWSSRCAS